MPITDHHDSPTSSACSADPNTCTAAHKPQAAPAALTPQPPVISLPQNYQPAVQPSYHSQPSYQPPPQPNYQPQPSYQPPPQPNYHPQPSYQPPPQPGYQTQPSYQPQPQPSYQQPPQPYNTGKDIICMLECKFMNTTIDRKHPERA
jgi:hypothetical protein